MYSTAMRVMLIAEGTPVLLVPQVRSVTHMKTALQEHAQFFLVPVCTNLALTLSLMAMRPMSIAAGVYVHRVLMGQVVRGALIVALIYVLTVHVYLFIAPMEYYQETRLMLTVEARSVLHVL